MVLLNFGGTFSKSRIHIILVFLAVTLYPKAIMASRKYSKFGSSNAQGPMPTI